MGIGQKIWRLNLKSSPIYWFAQGKYTKGLGVWGFWLALWTIIALATTKPKDKNANMFKPVITNNNKEKENSNV